MGLIGNEGFLTVTLTLNNKNAPINFIIQCSDSALQMDASLFSHQLKKFGTKKIDIKLSLYFTATTHSNRRM